MVVAGIYRPKHAINFIIAFKLNIDFRSQRQIEFIPINESGEQDATGCL